MNDGRVAGHQHAPQGLAHGVGHRQVDRQDGGEEHQALALWEVGVGDAGVVDQNVHVLAKRGHCTLKELLQVGQLGEVGLDKQKVGLVLFDDGIMIAKQRAQVNANHAVPGLCQSHECRHRVWTWFHSGYVDAMRARLPLRTSRNALQVHRPMPFTRLTPVMTATRLAVLMVAVTCPPIDQRAWRRHTTPSQVLSSSATTNNRMIV